MKNALRLFGVPAAIAVLVASFASPAQAMSRSDVVALAGSGAKAIDVQLNVAHWYVDEDLPYHVSLTSRIRFGDQATTATDCRITAWLGLTSLDLGYEWTSPKVTHSCAGALPRYGGAEQWVPTNRASYAHFRGGTSAEWSVGRVCVDLYYNNSKSSGVQLCDEGPQWVIGS